jgi:hypothetical protein
MQTWEYTTVVQKHSSETGEVSTEAAQINLNQLGDQGRELVAPAKDLLVPVAG